MPKQKQKVVEDYNTHRTEIYDNNKTKARKEEMEAYYCQELMTLVKHYSIMWKWRDKIKIYTITLKGAADNKTKSYSQ